MSSPRKKKAKAAAAAATAAAPTAEAAAAASALEPEAPKHQQRPSPVLACVLSFLVLPVLAVTLALYYRHIELNPPLVVESNWDGKVTQLSLLRHSVRSRLSSFSRLRCRVCRRWCSRPPRTGSWKTKPNSLPS